MSKTNYPGIDYSGPNATCNRDSETGIRYGIISQNSVMPEALNDVFTYGRDLGFENAEQELKDNLRRVLKDYFSDYKHGTEASRLDVAVEDTLNALDGWSNNMGSSGPYYYEPGGYALKTNETGDLWVLKSPYYTYAQFCSPCAPGGCYLSSPLEVLHDANNKPLNVPESNKCYCLGADYFEDGKAPYDIFSIVTNECIG